MRYNYKLYGAILGDLAGQPYEFPIMKGPYENIPIYNKQSHFTDDTILTIASAAYMLGYHESIEAAYRRWGTTYNGDYYGKGFKAWLSTKPGTKGDSFGNGCLMRMSPFMYCSDPLVHALSSCLTSHCHDDSLLSVGKLVEHYYPKQYPSERELPQKYKRFKVDAPSTIEFVQDVFAHTTSTHSAIIKAIECGGDTDTTASIVGEMKNFWEKDLNEDDANYVESKLTREMLLVLKTFNRKF